MYFCKRGLRGFSLIELLAVMLIMVALLGVSIPALQNMGRQSGRHGAVTVLLNSFEQARVAALTSGANTYVAFADASFPEHSLRLRAFIIFRDRLEDDAGSGLYVPLSKWMDLPRGVYFKDLENTLLREEVLPLADGSVPRTTAGTAVPVVQFNSTGAIQQPVRNLRLFISEQGEGNAQYFERISFSRFTGRAVLDISTLN